MAILVTKAEREDVPELQRLINALADFEKLEPPTPDAQARFLEDGWPLSGKEPKFTAWLAEVQGGDEKSNEYAGYAITFFTYSSFLAQPTLYLEDLFILPAYRKQGIGTKLMERLFREAKEKGCGRMEWVVLDWNVDAQEFYHKFGASRQTEWLPYRVKFDLDET